MSYVKPYIREVNGKRIYVKGHERRDGMRESPRENPFQIYDESPTDAEIALDEVNSYNGADPWKDIVESMGPDILNIDQKRIEKEYPESRAFLSHIFFKDGTSMSYNGSKWEIDNK